MKILVINGPNLNLLGLREPELYGKNSYASLCTEIEMFCKKNKINCEIFQSNFEGEIVEKIQSAYQNFDAIVINPAAYTHTSVAILDALKAVAIPACEVHLTDIESREDFRRHSFVSLYAEKRFCGEGFNGYLKALEYLNKKYAK